jgi:hypothetical protein
VLHEGRVGAQRPIESTLDHAHGRQAAAAGAGHRRGGKDRQGMMLEQLERQLPAGWEEQRVRILESETSLAV